MAKYEVKDVVCDYGLFENGKLVLVCNSRRNAFLIKAIMDCDGILNGNQTGSYIFTDEHFKSFWDKYNEMKSVELN